MGLMAQVLTRMKMNWLGNYAPASEYRATFNIIVFLFVGFWVFQSIFTPSSIKCDYDDEEEVKCLTESASTWQQTVYNAVAFLFWLYTLVVLAKVRRAVR